MISLVERSTPVNTPSPALGMVDLAKYNLHLLSPSAVEIDALEYKIINVVAVAATHGHRKPNIISQQY